ncbi:MAG: CcmD family protein [Vicingaceae bacterium]
MKFVLGIILSFLSFLTQAQPIEMADQMRASGKIYVVVAVLVTILVGLIIFLITIDRKVKRIEQELKQSNASK